MASSRLPSIASLFRLGPPLLGLAAAAALLVEPAVAQAAGGGGSLTSFLQNVVDLLTGAAGRLVAIIAVAITGIGWMMGGISSRGAISVVLGVFLLFSSAWIVDQIIGGGGA